MTPKHRLLPLVLATAVACSAPPAAPEQSDSFPVATPRLAPSTYERSYVTNLSARRRTEVRARARGIVEAVHVDEGQAVKEGDLLFVVSAGELEHELEKARAARKSAEAELQAARVERNNTSMLHERNIVSESELALADARLQAARARLDEARAVEGQADLAARYSRVRAPFAGVVNRIPHKLGATVDEGELLTTITDTSEMLAYFRLSEQEYLAAWAPGRGEPVREVHLRLADGQIYSQAGTIDAMETEIDTGTGSIGLRARFPNPAGVLLHGGSGTVSVKVPLGEALLVPQKSTFQVQDQIYVYALDADGAARARRIEPVSRLGEFFVVRSGLGPDEKFIVEGLQHVREGDRIAARPVALAAGN